MAYSYRLLCAFTIFCSLFGISLCLASSQCDSTAPILLDHFASSVRNDSLYSDLFHLLRIRSVSANQNHTQDVRDAVQWTVDKLRSIGFDSADFMETGGHPVAFGHLKSQVKNAKTILFYGHVDVQPADASSPDENWDSDPFEPVIRDEIIYGRGTTDDKGPVVALLAALQTMIEQSAVPNLNIKVFIEGQEEIGSPQIPAFIQKHKRLLSTDVAISVDGPTIIAEDVPGICLGVKGSVALQVDVQSSDSDLHSGIYGGIKMNPAIVASHLISSFHHANGSIAVNGFYQNCVELSTSDKDDFNSYPIDLKSDLAQFGIAHDFGEDGYTARERQFGRPTLDILGMSSGYFQEGLKTIIPASAMFKVGVRIVPNQQPEEILSKLEKHITLHSPSHINVSITRLPFVAAPATLDRNSEIISSIRVVLNRMYKKHVAGYKMGGSIPAIELFQKYLGVDPAILSTSLITDNLHAPNEFFSIKRFDENVHAIILTLLQLQYSDCSENGDLDKQEL